MVKWLRLATPCMQADLPITCRQPFVSEPHGTHKMLLATSPRYEWATKWDNYCTYAYRNPRWRPRMHVFYETLEQTYKAIIQIACKNAE